MADPTDAQPFDQLSHDYLALAFGLDQHVEGFIDAYSGPPEVRARLTRAEPATPAGLLEQARVLVEQVGMADDLPPARRTYLTAQVGAMVALAEGLAGEPLSFQDEVSRYFEVPATRTPETALEEALRLLDDALPGRGSEPAQLGARMAAWKRGLVVSPETARDLLGVIVPEIQSRTRRLVDLPDGESVEFQLVSNKPWGGYNWYLGGARSLVEINTDLPIHVNGLTGLVAHEAYPGHHTEHTLKEMRLFRGEGWGEFAVQLILTPQAVVSEGIATLAEGAIFPDDEGIRWQVAELYPAAGITGDAEQEIRIRDAQRALRAVSSNATLLLHADGASEDDVVAYLVRYGLRDEAEARHHLRFLTDPLWRAYVFTYHAGRDLLAAWLDRAADSAERDRRFVRLLTEPTTPGMIRAELAGG